MKTTSLSWLILVASAAMAVACVDDTKTDDSGDSIDLGDGGSAGDGGSGDGGSGDGGSGDGGSAAGWVGERELVLSIPDMGPVCDIWWDSWGDESSDICDGCAWAYDLEFDYVGDDLGGCGDGGDGWLPAYTVGYAPDYKIPGYGTYDLMFMDYQGTWYFLGYVTDYTGSSIDYTMSWYNYGTYYTYYYYWYGSGTF